MMNQKIYKISGLALMILTILLLLVRGRQLFGLFFALLISAILFFMGWSYYKISKNKQKQNKLTSSSLIIAIISSILFISFLSYDLLIATSDPDGGNYIIAGMILFLIGILYLISFILLGINKIKKW